MPIFTATLPLSLYIHIPWCVRKCPYCDFNSHEAKESLPQDLYISSLLRDLEQKLPLIKNRLVASIFFGGGTPSLFTGKAIAAILEGVAQRLSFVDGIEITLEANPGTIDHARFRDFRAAGINRLSLGVQSLQDDKLKTLGRIHNSQSAKKAIQIAKSAGFTNFNLDLMYGLPNQSIADALSDIKTALAFEPPHFSWYQLTIEPNTYFHHHTPPLPADDMIWDMQQQGLEILNQAGLKQYEVSAYAKPNQECKHNRNYWEFGDYLGIGAGAHSKLTDINNGEVIRFAQVKHPKEYLTLSEHKAPIKTLSQQDLIFEFMLNALRLTRGVPLALFEERTGLSAHHIEPILTIARKKQLLTHDSTHVCPSPLGARFLNNLVSLFL